MADIVYALCDEKVDRGALLEHARNASNNVLCVDGTSATKKTTILQRTGHQVTKIQKLAKFKNINRYFPSMLGYICTGLRTFKLGSMRLNDRSPLNPLEWHVLWCCMSDYFVNNGNVYPIDLSKYEVIMKKLKKSFFYEFFSRKINCLAFIDSNCSRCDEIRGRRNEGSDAQRSKWRFYTPMQNMMYSVLYEGRVIDMAWFDEFTTEDVCHGISMWIRDLVDDMAKLDIDRRVPLSNLCLPVNYPEMDYASENMKTHAYRCVGRVGCKIINNECDKKNIADTLKAQYLPQYVSIKPVQPPICALLHQRVMRVEASDDKYQVNEPVDPFTITDKSMKNHDALPITLMDFTDEDDDFKESDFFN